VSPGQFRRIVRSAGEEAGVDLSEVTGNGFTPYRERGPQRHRASHPSIGPGGIHTMGRVLYIVAREQPLLCGYLMATVGARSPDGQNVEIKLDERRGERRLQPEARDPERRRGERRRQPNYYSDLRSRGYATVVWSEATLSPSDQPSPEPVMVWRPRSTWWHRAARARWRSRMRWGRCGLIAFLFAVVGVSIVLGRSLYQAADLPRRVVSSNTPGSARQPEDARSLAPASKADTSSPVGPPAPPSSPPPVRVVTTRSSGLVLSVNPTARTLVLEDRGAAAAASRLRVELAPDARVVLSERDDRAEDLSHPFKDTVISLSDIRKGDFVVVEMRGPEGKALARSLVVTLRSHEEAGGRRSP
jgi:hypothetical protein